MNIQVERIPESESPHLPSPNNYTRSNCHPETHPPLKQHALKGTGYMVDELRDLPIIIANLIDG